MTYVYGIPQKHPDIGRGFVNSLITSKVSDLPEDIERIGFPSIPSNLRAGDAIAHGDQVFYIFKRVILPVEINFVGGYNVLYLAWI